MRFRVWLPVLQTAAMLLALWAPWAPKAHAIDLIPANGREIKAWKLIPGFSAIEWAEGLNLPAAAIAVPAEFAFRKTDALPNDETRLYGFWIVGFVCWYMVGRFVDDVVRWRRSGSLPTKNRGDLAFALLAVPSTLLLGGAFLFGGGAPPILAAWSAVWVAISFSALGFRVLQLIQQRRRIPLA